MGKVQCLGCCKLNGMALNRSRAGRKVGESQPLGSSVRELDLHSEGPDALMIKLKWGRTDRIRFLGCNTILWLNGY